MADATKILTHRRFASPERLQELATAGALVIDETRDWTDMDLKEPQYGEELLGTLEPDEKGLFFALYDANREMEDATRNMMGNQIARVGQTIRDSDRSKSLHEAVTEAQMSFESDDEAMAYFRLQKLSAMLHANFHWAIGERFNAHDYVLGVRTQGRVYKVERRY